MKLAQLLCEFEIPFLPNYVVPKTHLYRGILNGAPNVPMYEEPIRTDRRPLDSSRSGTEVFNKLFDHYHGHANIRSRAVFCSNDIEEALRYTRRQDKGSIVLTLPHKQSMIAYHPRSRDSLRIVSYCEELWEDLMFMDANGDDFGLDGVAIDPFRMTGAQLLECGRIASGWDNEFALRYKRTTEAMAEYIVVNANQLEHVDRVTEFMIFNAPTVAYLNPTVVGIDPNTVGRMDPNELIKRFTSLNSQQLRPS